MARLSLDEVLMQNAKNWARRSTCLRRQVGSIFTIDGRPIAAGFNGSIQGGKHCDEFGCIIENNHCIRCIHSEANGIFNANSHGQTLRGSIIHTTSHPCLKCAMALYMVGVREVVYLDDYPYTDKEKEIFIDFSSKMKWRKYG